MCSSDLHKCFPVTITGKLIAEAMGKVKKEGVITVEEAKGKRRHPQRGRETLPGYIYESEKYLQKAGAVVLEISAGEDKWWSICAAS